MIPYPVPPLLGLSILVTRPAIQALTLCQRIEAQGGIALSLPTIAIESIEIESTSATIDYDWIVFISTNAVEHGLKYVRIGAATKIAAIGKSTAAALALQKIAVHASPERNATSETLLKHAELTQLNDKRMLVVRGIGGRELLRDEFVNRGARVDVLEVYRRVKVEIDTDAMIALEKRWQDEGIDIVTLTSVEILENLWSMLSDSGRRLLARTTIAVVSERIAQAAIALGLHGPCILSQAADDDALLGTIANWHTRAHIQY